MAFDPGGSLPQRAPYTAGSGIPSPAAALSHAEIQVHDALGALDKLMSYNLFSVLRNEPPSLVGREFMQLAKEPAWGRGIQKIFEVLGSFAQPPALEGVAEPPVGRKPKASSMAHPVMAGFQTLSKTAHELGTILRQAVSTAATGESLVLPDGTEFQGPLSAGRPAGVGRLTTPDGTVMLGEFGIADPSAELRSVHDLEVTGWGIVQEPDGTLKAGSFGTVRVPPHGPGKFEGISVELEQTVLQIHNGDDVWSIAPDGWGWSTKTPSSKREQLLASVRADGSVVVARSSQTEFALRHERTLGLSSLGRGAMDALVALNAHHSKGLDLGDLPDRPLAILREDYRRHTPLTSSIDRLVEKAGGELGPLVKSADVSGLQELQDEVIANAYLISELQDPAVRAQVRATSQRRPVIVQGGWLGHAVAYVFYRDQLVVCNRGSGAWEIPGSLGPKGMRVRSEAHFEFAPQNFEEICRRLISVKNLPDAEAKEVMYSNSRDSLLDLARNWQYAQQPLIQGSQTAQRRGNCTFLSPLTAMYVSTKLLLEDMLAQQFPQEPPERITRFANFLSREDYRGVRELQKAHARLILKDLRIDLPGENRRLYVPHQRTPEEEPVIPEHARGVLTDEQDVMIYEGELVRGKPEGFGRGKTEDGLFEGEWRAGSPQGMGELELPDGRRFAGRFENGKIEGKGRLTPPEGPARAALFREGRLYATPNQAHGSS
jgi:hypothetical protein